MEVAMQHRSNTMLSFGDIMSILLVCMVLVCILMSANIAQEHYADINLERYQGQNNQTVSPGAKDLFLSITEEGTYVFEGESMEASQTFKVYERAIEQLKRIMPTKLFLRADREVDFGKVHQVFNATSAMGIPVALAVQLP
jgi:biopolymer transport protein ExbD